jgi:replicative DNA helicase
MDFDKHFEEDILARALVDVGYLRKASKILNAHHFNSPQHAWIWDNIRDIWMKYRELTNPKLMSERAKADYPKDDDRKPFVELAIKMFKLKPTHSDSALDELARFVKTVNAQISMEEAATALEKGDIEATYKSLRGLLRKDVSTREYTTISWSEEFEERQRERKLRHDHPELYTIIPTGWKKLDRIIGGLELGELGLIMATTGKGKSIALNNLAHAAVVRGFETVYFPLEMPARQVAMRQDTRWLQYSYNKLKKYNWKPSELREIKRRLKHARKRYDNKLKIVSMPLRKCTVDTIHSALEDLQQEQDFRPKLVLIDSGDHMKSVDRSESFRLDQAEVYWSLKSLAEEDGYAVWSSTQAGRDWVDETATAEAASESYDKARIADIMLSINTPKKDSRSSKIAVDEDGEEMATISATNHTESSTYSQLYLAKYRDGRSRVTIPLHNDFDRMIMEELEQ